MKKDGIQTRNRKMSAKSKKKKSGDMCQNPMDFFKPGFDKHFSTFPSPNFSPAAMHNPMHSYMGSSSAHALGNGFMATQSPHHNPAAAHHHHSGFSAGGFSGLGHTPSSISGLGSSLSSFNSLQGSGLSLTSGSGIVGAMA